MNQNITRSMLLDSFIHGLIIRLNVSKNGQIYRVAGRVSALQMESGGYSGPLAHFNVTITDGRNVYTTYVKTID